MITAFIQARMNSQRLPGKSMMELHNKPLLQHVIERVKRSYLLDNIVVITSTNPSDEKIVELCERLNVDYFAGSEDDVLYRAYQGLKKKSPNTIVRICADQPFIESEIIDAAIKICLTHYDYDLITTTLERTYPIGVDVEVFDFSLLMRLHRITKKPSHREHVTKYIYDNKDKFKIFSMKAPKELSYPQIRLTVDTINDYNRLKYYFDTLSKVRSFISLEDVIKIAARKNPLIVIRADGSNKKGLGDLVSTENIVSSLSIPCDIIYLTKDYPEGINYLKNKNFNTISIPLDIKDEKYFVKKTLTDLLPDFVIFGLYPYEKYINDLTPLFHSLIIDYHCRQSINSDIILNWDLLDKHQYTYENEKVIKLFGPEYIPLKKKINRLHNKEKIINDDIKKIIITLGGSDCSHLGNKTLSWLKESNSNEKIHITLVIGKACKDDIKTNDENIEIINDPQDLYERIYNADLGICSGGLTAFEFCALGTPFLSIAAVDHQKQRLQKLHDLGATFYLGDYKSISKEIFLEYFRLAQFILNRNSLSYHSKKIDDGGGSKRIAKVIESFLQ